MNLSPLPPEIRFLPVPERLILVEQIWDSIMEDGEQIELTDARKAELDRRLAAHESSPESGSTWEEVEKRLRNRSNRTKKFARRLFANSHTSSATWLRAIESL